jgi:hypothetical protein
MVSEVACLHPMQKQAIANIETQALKLKPEAVAILSEVLRMSNLPAPSSLNAALSSIREHARTALHFHPDRPAGPSGRTVVRSLLEDGIYRSQFETGISNGLVATQAGGPRDEWENVLFSGAYHPSVDDTGAGGRDHDGVFQPALRPKYGALDLMRNADGPAPRFGSCYFVLRQSVSTRSTFTFGGSQADPKYRGTVDTFEPVLGALFEECFLRDSVLGVAGIRPPGLMAKLLELEKPFSPGGGMPSRNLDHIIEAQIHGLVLLDQDIEAVVADPSFQGTDTGDNLQAMSTKYRFPLFWHHGFRLMVADVPLDFRGPTMPSLAKRVAKNGVVDAASIGKGVRDLTNDPDQWKDRGTFKEVLQELKLLWHVMVRYGSPYDQTSDAYN